MQNHIFLKYSFGVKDRGQFLNNLIFPFKKFPASFIKEDSNLLVFGYFASYDQNLTLDKAIGLAASKKFRELINYNADWMIFIYDEVNRSLSAIHDITGKFNLYFASVNREFILSTDFSLIKNKLAKLSLNFNNVLDELTLANLMSVADETVLNEISQLPPGALLYIVNGKWQIIPIMDPNTYFTKEIKLCVDTAQFTGEFLEVLSYVIKARLKALSNFKYGSVISSGFDSSLITYLVKKLSQSDFPVLSLTSKYTESDSNSQIVRTFADSHKLDLDFIAADKLIALSDFEVNWIKDRYYPSGCDVDWINALYTNAKIKGVTALFTGEGGDEVSQSYKLEEEVRFQIQFCYQSAVLEPMTTYGFDTLYTSKGVSAILDRQRFTRKKFFPVPLAVSCITAFRPAFSLYWENDIWPLSPFTDSRVTGVARKLPLELQRNFDKQQIWTDRTDIFLPQQFRMKGSMEKQTKLFLTERREFIIKTLENSVLGQLGLIKSNEIIRNISDGNIKFYEPEAIALQLLMILKLECFIQTNKLIF